MTQSW